MNTQEAIKKEFLNIFEVSQLFDTSGITTRRYINGIFEEIELLESQLKTSDPAGQALLGQKIKALSGKVRKRVIGKNKNNENIFVLELAKKEAMTKWELRPTIKAVIKEAETPVNEQPPEPAPEPAQETIQTPPLQAPVQAPSQTSNQNFVTDIYGQKYIGLLESQLVEKDNTIKDLRETNKFLSISNSKLNEQLKFLIEKPQNQTPPPQNA